MENNVLKRSLKVETSSSDYKITKNSIPMKGKNPLLSDHCVNYLNYRIEQEEFSSRLYLSMSMWLNNEGYTGAAALWKKYSNEEMGHADIARNYLLAMGVQPSTPKLDSPGNNYTGLPEIIKKSHEHEITITNQIKDLATEAFKKGDHMLYELALAYLKEQVEELDKTQTWVDKINTFGTDKIALRLLDNEMSEL
jgi:ferritin